MTASTLRTLACVPLVAIAARAAAQEPPAPPCEGRDPAAAPCRAPYDTAPVLDPASEPPLAEGVPRRPLVWIYVDETGAVRRALIQRPLGVDWDIAARDRALRFRFQPAALAGRPVGAWVLMPVAAVPPPPSCADLAMSVPRSAGALFADSAVVEGPEPGTRFRYAARGFGIDLFVHPHHAGETAQGEVERTLALLRQDPSRGADSIAVVRAGAERVPLENIRHRGRDSLAVIRARVNPPGVRPPPPMRPAEFVGYSAVFRGKLTGRTVESYLGVFPAGDQDLRIHASHPRTGDAGRQVQEFVEQILANRAWRMNDCPR